MTSCAELGMNLNAAGPAYYQQQQQQHTRPERGGAEWAVAKHLKKLEKKMITVNRLLLLVLAIEVMRFMTSK